MSLSPDVAQLIRTNTTLNLKIEDPDWEGARGYLVEKRDLVLHFPVSKPFLPECPLEMRVLVMCTPAVLVQGELKSATSADDAECALELALEQGMDEQKARYMIFDQRTGKARKSRYKLIVTQAHTWNCA